MILGGLAAVIYTDTLQMFVMVIGALVLMAISQYHYLYYQIWRVFFCGVVWCDACMGTRCISIR